MPDDFRLSREAMEGPARAGKMTQKEGKLRYADNIDNRLEY
jgi:hypothetical protein